MVELVLSWEELEGHEDLGSQLAVLKQSGGAGRAKRASLEGGGEWVLTSQGRLSLRLTRYGCICCSPGIPVPFKSLWPCTSPSGFPGAHLQSMLTEAANNTACPAWSDSQPGPSTLQHSGHQVYARGQEMEATGPQMGTGAES